MTRGARVAAGVAALARRLLAPAGASHLAIALRSAAAVLAVALPVAGVLWWANRPADIVVGTPPAPTTTAAPGPTIITGEPPAEAAPTTGDPDSPGGRAGGRSVPLLVAAPPDGSPYGPAIPFFSDVPVPDHLVFVLVVGSDARPGEPVTRTRADSIHLVAANPHTGTGTVLGIPRDSWVEIPGHGRGKINDALARGGPDLLSATVRRVTGLPVHYYVVTGFAGFEAMTNAMGGVHHHVDHAMRDKASGAFFERGWHHFDGYEALAYSRNRKDVAYGDFSRSSNQGSLMLSALTKLRAEVGDADGIRRWAGVLIEHAHLDLSFGELEQLATLARRLDPRRLTNVVAPGRIGTAGRQSVVYLTEEAARLFEDLRDDATVGQATPPPTTAPPPPPTTTTTAPPPPTTTTPPAPTTTVLDPL